MKPMTSLLLTLTALAVVYCGYVLLHSASTMAWLMLTFVALFVALAWTQASALARRGNHQGMSAILSLTFIATVYFVMFAQFVTFGPR